MKLAYILNKVFMTLNFATLCNESYIMIPILFESYTLELEILVLNLHRNTIFDFPFTTIFTIVVKKCSKLIFLHVSVKNLIPGFKHYVGITGNNIKATTNIVTDKSSLIN